MALELTGIENVEFYSAHYLDAVLESDLKGLFEGWRKAHEDEGKPLPFDRLGTLQSAYLKAAERANGERSPDLRWQCARDFHAQLLEVLGYPYQPSAEPLAGEAICPLLTALEKDGRPFLWIIDAPFAEREDDDPLAAPPLDVQLPADADAALLPKAEDNKKDRASWRELLDAHIFRGEHAPRWVIALSGREALLIDRYKWLQGRYLRFDLGQILIERKKKVLQAVCGLLHRDAVAPEAGLCLHDTLDENSHKHAFAVSNDLKYGVRRAVELLGNEAVWFRRNVQKQAVFDETAFPPEQLTSECLTWLYRLLFVFYVEARGGELGVVPMGADVYRHGYSVETLRDLELVPLATEQARNGYFIHDSLRTLFRIMNEGYPADQPGTAALGLEESYHDSMRIGALNSPLFDNERLTLLRNVRFRNVVLQEILQLLSLSAEKRGKARGRISYAQLGINQLGAVYEGILSYTGFFATEDLYEVAAEKDCEELSGKSAAERESLKTYFVPASRIGDYKDGEIVKDEDGKKVVHPKGSFIFRLAGRNREKSASYYTPEVLTRCLVKYALKELLWEEGEEGERPKRKKTAEEILALTICEPAMGSSAFLIEAVDQLADAYLDARQEEKGERIPPEDYQREKRRVKARLATNNCYGVDLNPTAVELAKTSLWLATLYEGGKCPWFGLRLATGNSLVGARREVFRTADVTRKGTKDNPNWLGLVPEPVTLHHGDGGPPLDERWMPPPRPKGTIYHFLLPAEGMAAFDNDKVIRELAPESVKRIKEWRKDFCKPFSKKDAERLEQISDAVDRLFAQVVRERVLATQETSDRISVWGEPQSDPKADLLVRDQEEIAASLEDRSSAYRRLMLAMDVWCALWFWPIEAASLLPDRATWLAQLELILKGQVTYEPVYDQGSLFDDLHPADQGESATHQDMESGIHAKKGVSAERLRHLQTLSDAFSERRSHYLEECGLADIDAVLDGNSALRAAQDVAVQLRFHHWQLRFAEVFAARGGFDLVVGNPPWIRLQWNEGPVLADFEPKIEVQNKSAPEIHRLRDDLLHGRLARPTYLTAFVELEGLQSYFRGAQNFQLLSGIQPNLYKCFIVQSMQLLRPTGLAGFVHEEGVFDDPKGGPLREAIYRRLAFHFHFINELSWFPEVGHQKAFSLNGYRSVAQKVSALLMSNLFHPRTIDYSLAHDGHGQVPGIKSESGEWETLGHRERVVRLTESVLSVFAAVFEQESVPVLSARLPALHATALLEILKKFSGQQGRLGDEPDSYFATKLWDETNAQKAQQIERHVGFPSDIREWVLSGPHFYVATPFNKTPNDGCQSKGDYALIDLEEIGATYLPRTIYRPTKQARVHHWSGRPVTEYYRLASREMAAPSIERTLISCIVPRGVGHISTVMGTCFRSTDLLLKMAALTSSCVMDFYVKVTGKGHVDQSIISAYPMTGEWVGDPFLRLRTLRLNCLTAHYQELWNSSFEAQFGQDSWASQDRRLDELGTVDAAWGRRSAIRSDLMRRQALVEIDVLIGMLLGLDREQLIAMFRIQLSVLRESDRSRLFDQRGRIVPMAKTSGGRPAASLGELAATLKEQAGFDVHAEYHPDGTKTQELRKQKLRLAKKEADVLGVAERCTMADLLAETEVRWSDEDHPEGRSVRLVGLRYTDPGLEPRMERVYPTPWTRCDREADYRQAWAEFERRLGKKMPEGSPLKDG